MPTTSYDLRLFGLDLRELGREWLKPWRELHRSRFFAWLTPEVPVDVLRLDGRRELWLGSKPLALAQQPKDTPRFFAVELPESMLLRRPVRMPAMSAAELSAAASLEAHSVSPFPAQDLSWGYVVRESNDRRMEIDLVLASRKQIERFLVSQPHAQPTGAPPEVWALSPNGHSPAILGGFGEQTRQSYVARLRSREYRLLAVAAVVLVAIAITPTLQIRQRSLQAASRFAELQNRTAALTQSREQLVKTRENLLAFHELAGNAADPLAVLDMLTRILPDDAYLRSFQFQDNKATVSGEANNAAALMSRLSEVAGVSDVRAPGAATRSIGAQKENFTIEFMAAPDVFRDVGALTTAQQGRSEDPEKSQQKEALARFTPAPLDTKDIAQKSGGEAAVTAPAVPPPVAPPPAISAPQPPAATSPGAPSPFSIGGRTR